jgi:hypothetical protein
MCRLGPKRLLLVGYIGFTLTRNTLLCFRNVPVSLF